MPFKTEEVKDAFLQWANLWNGNPQEGNACDDAVFYAFVLEFFKHEQLCELEPDLFIRYAKLHIKTSKNHNSGLIQRYYKRLVLYYNFLCESTKKGWISIEK